MARSQSPESQGAAANPGTLFVVATPIGNLSDLSDRARSVLSEVAAIAAEDTRHTGNLLKTLGLTTPLVSLHEHNEAARAPQVLARLRNGENVALVSDAGTPLISDPGFTLVRACIEAGFRVVPIPGPCAMVAALSVTGLPTDRFAFEGFLPTKTKQRRDRLTSLKSDTRTLVFYEAPHRIGETLQDIAATFGADRRCVLARELTKQFETLYHGTAKELAERTKIDSDMQRGEIVIVTAGAAEETAAAYDNDHLLRVLLAELAPAQAAKLAARLTQGKRDDLYRRAVELSAEK